MALNIQKYEEKLKQLKRDMHFQSREDQNKIHFIKLHEGRNILRFLPPKEEDGMFYEEVRVHYNVPCGNGKIKQVVCSNDVHCPICNLIQTLKVGSEEEKKQVEKMKPRLKYYFNVIDMELPETHKLYGKVQVLSTGVSIFEDLLNIIVDPDFGDITDPDNGRDVIINKSGNGLNTEYRVNARPMQTAVENFHKEDLIDLSIFAKTRSTEDVLYLLEHGEYPKRNK